MYVAMHHRRADNVSRGFGCACAEDPLDCKRRKARVLLWPLSFTTCLLLYNFVLYSCSTATTNTNVRTRTAQC